MARCYLNASSNALRRPPLRALASLASPPAPAPAPNPSSSFSSSLSSSSSPAPAWPERTFLLSLANKLGYTQVASLARLRRVDLAAHGGAALLAAHGNSPRALVRAAFPEHAWHAWLFNAVPNGFWTDRGRRASYLAWLRERLGLREDEALYSLSKRSFLENDGGGFLNYYGGSVIRALVDLVPSVQWLPWKFSHVAPSFWARPENQAAYLAWLASELNLRRFEDWYALDKDAMLCHAGAGLLALHRSSLVSVLRHNFPQYPWRAWRFHKAPKEHEWADAASLLLHLETALGLHSTGEWSKVAFSRLPAGKSIVNHYGGLQAFVRAFPERSLGWSERAKPGDPTSASFDEHALLSALQTAYPGELVLSNYRHPQLRYEASGLPMQLDVYLPSLRLAFEVQGEQHFVQKQSFGKPLDEQRRRDAEKARRCREAGITLVLLPYWQTASQDQLLRIVQEAQLHKAAEL